jgi:hypothetical protein
MRYTSEIAPTVSSIGIFGSVDVDGFHAKTGQGIGEEGLHCSRTAIEANPAASGAPQCAKLYAQNVFIPRHAL